MQTLKDQIHEKILQAAKEEFLANGFDAASMREIARGAGVSTSNVYNYFSGKEELFYSLTDSLYHAIAVLAKRVLDYKACQDFGDEQFLKKFSRIVPQRFSSLIKQHRDEILLLFDCSGGTKYAGFKESIIAMLEKNFLENLKATDHAGGLKDSFLMHILAANLVEGLLEIIRNYRNDTWVDSNVHSLMNYHIRGMTQFFT